MPLITAHALNGLGLKDQANRIVPRCQMDLLAGELGVDPLELRRTNFVESGDTLPIGQPLDTVGRAPGDDRRGR